VAQRVEISCINKSDRDNPYDRILHVGGRNPDGTRWKLSELETIRCIENGTHAFYVHQIGHTVDVEVVVATGQHGNKYLKTTADREHPHGLLNLPECPEHERPRA
jgi:Protein of unknown function (DUF3892)